MKTLNRITEKIVKLIMILSSTTVFIVCFMQVFSRFVLSLPIPWASDITRIAFVYAVFIGAAYSAKNDDHLNLDVLLSLLKPKPRMILQLINHIILTIFLGFVAAYGISFVLNSGSTQRLPYLPWPMAVMYCSIPIGAIIMIFYYIQHIFSSVRTLLFKSKSQNNGGVV